MISWGSKRQPGLLGTIQTNYLFILLYYMPPTCVFLSISIALYLSVFSLKLFLSSHIAVYLPLLVFLLVQLPLYLFVCFVYSFLFFSVVLLFFVAVVFVMLLLGCPVGHDAVVKAVFPPP